MKQFLLALVMVFGTVANAAKVIESTHRPDDVSPMMITFFEDASLDSTYVTVVGTLIGGAWLTQQVAVNIGYQEEGQETFTFEIVGEILSASISEGEDKTVYVQVTTGTGPFDSDEGMFKPGYTKYNLEVKYHGETDNKYSPTGTLSTIHYVEQ